MEPALTARERGKSELIGANNTHADAHGPAHDALAIVRSRPIAVTNSFSISAYGAVATSRLAITTRSNARRSADARALS